VKEVEKAEVIRRLRDLADKFEALGDDVAIDPPPAWLPREQQDEIRAALAEIDALLRELPADAKARAFLDPDKLN
jgi:hypothetical protein